MKKTISYIAALLLGGFALTSCNGDYATPPMELEEQTGTWDNPKTVTEILEGSVGEVWVKGYIVGWIDTKGGSNNVCDATTATFTVPATLDTNILMAADAEETDWTKCIPVQLPSGEVRTALNLVTHPEVLGKEVTVLGTVDKYFGIQTALKSLTAYNWGGLGLESMGQEPEGVIYSASFINNSWNDFKLEGELPEAANWQAGYTEAQLASLTEDELYALSRVKVWTLNKTYGLVASAYVGGTRYETDSRAVSPVVEIPAGSNAKMSFDWAGNYFTTLANMQTYVGIEIREAGADTWTELTVPVWPTGASWTFVGSGAIDLSSYDGKRVQIGIHYSSTTSMGGTLEFRNLIIAKGDDTTNQL